MTAAKDTELLKEKKPDFKKLRNDFPILSRMVNGKPLVYFDNGATTQKPLQVLEAIQHYYAYYNSNVHRGVHTLSQEATTAQEESREKVRQFINARSANEIIFTKGTTESINLVAASLSKFYFKPGDEIIISTMEHHSNIVPWQMACEQTGAKLKVIPINDAGEILFDEFEKLLNEKTKLVAVVHVSNSLGTINPVKKIIEKAHAKNIPVLLDGAQAIQHTQVDVQQLDCDFYCFSGHKMYGPTGIGILYGKEKWLEQMPPYQGGGEMIKHVTFAKTTYNDLPFKFEAGTPHIEGAIVLGTAIDYINNIGIDAIEVYEHELLKYATEQLSAIDKIKFIGTAKEKASVLSFLIEGVHPYDTGVILDKLGIAVRTGHHCTEPLMDRFGIPGTVRASLVFYNTKEEIDVLVSGVKKAQQMLA
jgi:cysteine desulfurase / selenocysteine lyase